jgi:hypothetical protein
MSGVDTLFIVGDVIHRRGSSSDKGSGTGALWLTCVREPIGVVAAVTEQARRFWQVF